MRYFGEKIFEVVKNGSKLILPNRTGTYRKSNIVFACCKNKTTTKIDKSTNEALTLTFFDQPLICKVHRLVRVGICPRMDFCFHFEF